MMIDDFGMWIAELKKACFLSQFNDILPKEIRTFAGWVL
jgi:hypothetical protein